MLLQRQLRAGIDRDALDLKSITGVNRLEITPRPMHTMCLRRGAMAVGLQAFDQFSDVLIAISGRHKNNIRGRGDDEILDAERRYKLTLTPHIASRRLFQDD